MKNNPYNRPGYTHAVGDANRDFYSSWANDNKRKVKAPKKTKADEVDKVIATDGAVAVAPAKKTGPVAKVLLVVLLVLCIAVVVVLNFFIPPELKEQLLATFMKLVGMQF